MEVAGLSCDLRNETSSRYERLVGVEPKYGVPGGQIRSGVGP